MGGGGSVASQVPTLVGGLAGEAKSQPEPCIERHWSQLLHRLGHVPYTTVAASPRSSTSRLRAFSGREPMQYFEASSVLGSCVVAGAWFGRVALGRPGSGSAIQRGADVGGGVVAEAAEGGGAV